MKEFFSAKPLISKKWNVFHWMSRIAVGFFICSAVLVIIFRFVPVPLTPLMLIRSTGSLLDKKWLGLAQTEADSKPSTALCDAKVYLV